MTAIRRTVRPSLALVWAFVAATVATGQTHFGPPTPGHAFARFRPVAEPLWHFPAPAVRKYPATYYVEGAVIGAGVLATTGAWFIGSCDFDSGCAGPGPIVAVTLAVALLGGTAGALVGGMFPAPHPRPLRGHAARAALLGATAGALWGFGVFPHFCLNGCNASEVRFGVSSAAVGALAGFIVGH